jgi:hypothetical protein
MEIQFLNKIEIQFLNKMEIQFLNKIENPILEQNRNPILEQNRNPILEQNVETSLNKYFKYIIKELKEASGSKKAAQEPKESGKKKEIHENKCSLNINERNIQNLVQKKSKILYKKNPKS